MFIWIMSSDYKFRQGLIYCLSCREWVKETDHPKNHKYCYDLEDFLATLSPGYYGALVRRGEDYLNKEDVEAYKAEIREKMKTFETLIHSIKHDPLKIDRDYRTQYFLISLLGDTKDYRAIEPLVRLLLEASEYRVRYSAANALARLGLKIEDPEIIQKLINVLEDARKYGKIRDFIVWVLLQTDEGKTAAPLIQFLKENYVKTDPSKCHLWTQESLTDDDLKLAYNFKTEFTLVNSDHFDRKVLKCEKCGQLYFYEFNEIVNFGRDDDMYSTFIPIEIKDVPELSKLTSMELLAITPRLQWDSGESIRWVKGEENAK